MGYLVYLFDISPMDISVEHFAPQWGQKQKEGLSQSNITHLS